MPQEEWASEIYCGPAYEIIIKKDNRYVCFSGIPSSYPEDLEKFIYEIYTKEKKNKMELIANQDSIQSVLKSFEKYVSPPDIYLPVRSTVKFQPPVIN